MNDKSLSLTGFHHLTAVTATAAQNHDFYTRVLGLRLVKKTVNQDDVSAYHLFYADGKASPGTDITFFDWPAARERRGTRSVVETGFRVAPGASLEWWRNRFHALGVPHSSVFERGGRKVVEFQDPEGQRLSLAEDSGAGGAHPWEKSTVPGEHQVRGLGPIRMSVPDLGPTDAVLTGVLNMAAEGAYLLAGAKVHVYRMGGSGPESELHVQVDPGLPAARQGAGGVHHVAFRTPDEGQYGAWEKRLAALGMPSSGPVNRFYFRSLYFREPGGVLFEIATDGPGFAADEPLESLGKRLALPPFLEARRAEIEGRLKPLAV
jgi:glyoxalase family protein